MAKLRDVALAIAGVVLAYVILLAVWGAFLMIHAESVAEVAGHEGLERYIGALEGLQVMPWVLFFLPAIIGTIVIVRILRRGDET